jgi:4-hydroxybenzoate polyprenyltransferase
VFLNPLAKFIVIVGVSLFYLYSIRLKRIIFVNNVLIAGAYVLTLLLGTLVSNSFVEPLILYFSIMGFIVGLAMEIMIDIIDVKGDKIFQIQTLSTRFGVRSASQIAAFLYLLIVILDPLPFFVMIDSRLYLDYVFLLGILIPIVSYLLIVKDLLRDQTPIGIFNLKRRLFITMQIGSLVYLLGVLR